MYKIYSRTLFFVFALFLCVASMSAQQLHTLSEIMDDMGESSIRYSIQSGYVQEAPVDYTLRVVDGLYYHETHPDGSFTLKEYQFPDEVLGIWAWSDTAYAEGNLEGAREGYLKVLNIDPTCFRAMTYIGETYFLEGNFIQAKKWLEDAIETNYFDHFAHWVLAHLYEVTGDNKAALQEITIAKVLNRNNPRLHSKFDEIYKLNKVTYNDWYFTPMYSLSESYNKEDDKIVVKILYDDYWLGYALVKAVQRFEPKYMPDTTKNSLSNAIYAGREAVLNLHAATSKITKKHIELKVLAESVNQRISDVYVMYEILLPENPMCSYMLNEQGVKLIADYVLNVRCKYKK